RTTPDRPAEFGAESLFRVRCNSAGKAKTLPPLSSQSLDQSCVASDFVSRGNLGLGRCQTACHGILTSADLSLQLIVSVAVGDQQEGVSAKFEVFWGNARRNSYPHDFSSIVDVHSVRQLLEARTPRNEHVQINHGAAVFPEKRVKSAVIRL